MQIPVVDIFAGPGGLGEGFSSFVPGQGPVNAGFRIVVSAEMEANAARTLRLRAFYRQFDTGQVPQSYYDYVAGRRNEPWTDSTRWAWDRACDEALQLTLGEPEDDRRLYARLRTVVSGDAPWVLIGGPPCQAYSLVGRARNRGIKGYKAEEDHRHFLYQHYLEIVRRFRPAAFVMENVKGILSSRVAGELVFPRIIEDLSHPGGRGGVRYRILPLVTPDGSLDSAPSDPQSSDFVLKSEQFGVPQARHRVVLLGLREDIPAIGGRFMTASEDRCTVADAIRGLPKLRSRVTDSSGGDWGLVSSHIMGKAAKASELAEPKVSNKLRSCQERVLGQRDPGCGGRWMRLRGDQKLPPHLASWLLDPRLDGHLNHEVRGHMRDDLARYAYAACFAAVYGRSPRGAGEFPRKLHPKHRNWTSGKFVDRFKVQFWRSPSSTITSHLSKDGHYFIHPDPMQLRSLSVREAARLQTFPDNYFFEGARGAQFRQVGNAVPPLMASGIAQTVHSVLVG